jgi:hypothetical protein
MRKEYGHALRSLFEKAMAQHCPTYEPTKVTSDYIWPGERAFRKRFNGVGDLWIVLSPNHKFEQFSIDIGWSRFARFPELSMRPSSIAPLDAYGQNEYFCRLGELVHGHDHWWTIEQFQAPPTIEDLMTSLEKLSASVAMERVQPRVDDAIEALEKHGIPYLETAIQHFASRDTSQATGSCR